MTQIERNQRRCTALFIQIMTTKNKREKRELIEEYAFWQNQHRMAKAIAEKRQTNPPNKHAIPII